MVERVVRKAHPGAIIDLHDADGIPGARGGSSKRCLR
jgi:hypothetical protein